MSGRPEGPLLALDTSTSSGSVAVSIGDRVLTEMTFATRAGHSSALQPAIDESVRSAGLVPSDLAAVVVGAGPGSFTGLRIAAATAKGIVQALGIPLYAYSSLLAAAAQLSPTGDTVCALVDARGRDVFAAAFRFRPSFEELLPPAVMTIDELLEAMPVLGGPVLVGDGALRHRDELLRGGAGAVAPAYLATPRAAALAWLVRTLPDIGRIDDPAAWEPSYLRKSGAERIAAGQRTGP